MNRREKIYDFYASALSDKFNSAGHFVIVSGIYASVIGALLGAYIGFNIGGIGGMIILVPILWFVSIYIPQFIYALLVGAVTLLGIASVYSIVILVMVGLVWGLSKLWGLGV